MPQLDWDDWDFDESLEPLSDNTQSALRLSPAESRDAVTPTAWHGPHRMPPRSRQSSRSRSPRRASPVTWALLSFGIAILMCGGFLMVWSFFGNRTELWTIGTPLALGGQAMILIGLVLQMDIIWQSSRDTSVTLDEIDEQISDLKRTTSLLTTTHGSPSRTFYHHMAEGASPQTLIADLKGQLDLLTVKMSSDRQR